MSSKWDQVKQTTARLKAIAAISEERLRQELLKSQGRFEFTCADPSISDREKLVILGREFGEIAHAVNVSGDRRPVLLEQQTKEHLRTELIQLAAVAAAWAESLDE
jgi:hypothetical protein